MEKFMYLFRGGMDTTQSAEAQQAQMQKWYTWIDGLNKKGSYVAGDPLLPSGKKLIGKKKTVTDGPFIEAKEMVGGYLIVLANDINDAVEISKDCPIFETDGSLEVRQIQKM